MRGSLPSVPPYHFMQIARKNLPPQGRHRKDCFILNIFLFYFCKIVCCDFWLLESGSLLLAFNRMSSEGSVQQFETEGVCFKKVYKKLKHNKMWPFLDHPVCGSKPQNMQGSNGRLFHFGSYKMQKLI